MDEWEPTDSEQREWDVVSRCLMGMRKWLGGPWRDCWEQYAPASLEELQDARELLDEQVENMTPSQQSVFLESKGELPVALRRWWRRRSAEKKKAEERQANLSQLLESAKKKLTPAEWAAVRGEQ